jgi:hypothetical protein
VRVAQGPSKTGERYPELLDEFEAIVRAEGVTHLKEGAPDIEEKLTYWRGLAAEMPQTAEGDAQ